MYSNINIIIQLLSGILAFFIVATCHEYTRAAISTALGDVIPKNEKTLTLNPLKHVEPVGAMFFIITYLLGYGAFGWSRTANTSSLYYKNRKRDALLVAILPTVANMVLAFIALLLWKMLPYGNMVSTFLNTLVFYNVAFAICNCLPIPPMDCVKVLSLLMPANKYFKYMQYEKIIQAIFLVLLIFGVFRAILNTALMLVVIGMDKLLFFL